MRRSRLAIVFLLVVLALLGVGAAVLLRGGHKPAPARTQPTAVTTATTPTWDGTFTRGFSDLVFVRAGAQLAFVTEHFSGLNTKTAKLHLTFTLPIPAKIPGWLSSSHFVLQGTDGRVWPIVFNRQASGSTLYVFVDASGLPTTMLAAAGISLTIHGPDGPFTIIPTPDAPPAGHSFAENK